MKHRRISQILAAAVLLIILLAIGIYAQASQRQFMEYARSLVSQNMAAINSTVDAYLSYALDNIQLTSHLASQLMTEEELEKAGQMLDQLTEKTPFNFIEYINRDGINCTDMGARFDASDREYYRQGIQGKNGIWINYNPVYSQEYLMNFYTPLNDDGEITGVLTGVIGTQTRIQPMLRGNFLGEEMIGILCDADYRIISATFPLEAAMYLEDVLTEFGISEAGKTQFYDHIASRDSSVFNILGDRGNSIACVSVNDASGWNVLQIVPADSFRKVVQQTSVPASLAISAIAVSLLSYFGYLVFISRRLQRRLQAETDAKMAQQIAISNTDKLTGFYNRRAYEDDLLHFPNVPTEQDYVYVSADVNGLKAVNDTMGHAAGDELLKGAAECLERCLGSYGKVYRVGGDEFAAQIFTSEYNLSFIDNDLVDTTARWKGKTVPELSISWGFASKREFPKHSVQEMARIADERMYQAKEKYYKTSGLDRRRQKSAYSALCASYNKILNVNLTEDKYTIVTMDRSEQTKEQGFDERISVWLRNFGTSGQVHPEDLDIYLRKTDIEFLRDHFRRSANPHMVYYRRKIDGVYRQTMMEMIRSEEYSDDNQTIYLYVKGIQ